MIQVSYDTDSDDSSVTEKDKKPKTPMTKKSKQGKDEGWGKIELSGLTYVTRSEELGIERHRKNTSKSIDCCCGNIRMNKVY